MTRDLSFDKKLTEAYLKLNEKSGDEATIWRAFLSLLDDSIDTSLLAIKADVPVLEKLVSGYSVRATARSLGIPSSEVHAVAKLWGIAPVVETLDFSPLVMYDKGMTGTQLESKLVDVLPVKLSLREYDIIITNIERYIDLLDFIKERDK
jgi:hypothetical protein